MRYEVGLSMKELRQLALHLDHTLALNMFDGRQLCHIMNLNAKKAIKLKDFVKARHHYIYAKEEEFRLGYWDNQFKDQAYFNPTNLVVSGGSKKWVFAIAEQLQLTEFQFRELLKMVRRMTGCASDRVYDVDEWLEKKGKVRFSLSRLIFDLGLSNEQIGRALGVAFESEELSEELEEQEGLWMRQEWFLRAEAGKRDALREYLYE
jgi:hypothetical protein